MAAQPDVTNRKALARNGGHPFSPSTVEKCPKNDLVKKLDTLLVDFFLAMLFVYRKIRVKHRNQTINRK
jgi:hypothetical protein